MIIDWFKFAPALFLLLIPIGLFHGKKVRVRTISRDWDGQWPQILNLGLHWIDLGRAALGAWLLLEALSLVPGTRGALRYAPLLTQAAVLIVASCLQAFVCKERDSAHAPFAFVTGLLFGFYPPTIAGFAILLAVTTAAGSRTPVAYFPILAVALSGLGYLFEGNKLLTRLAVGACAVMLPWLLSVMFSRDLVLSYRARRPTKDHPSQLPPHR
jgi:hypothetical protein